MEYQCTGCHAVLPDFKRGEPGWLYHKEKFYCPCCWSVKIMMAQREEDRPMPRILTNVIDEIKRHPNYSELPHRIRKRFFLSSNAYCRGDLYNKKVEHSFIRELWTELYKEAY